MTVLICGDAKRDQPPVRLLEVKGRPPGYGRRAAHRGQCKAREASLALAERENVGHDRTVAPDSTCSVEQAAGQLIQRP
jgi:hypothetical protein